MQTLTEFTVSSEELECFRTEEELLERCPNPANKLWRERSGCFPTRGVANPILTHYAANIDRVYC